jgi:hypothetical protein
VYVAVDLFIARCGHLIIDCYTLITQKFFDVGLFDSTILD